MQTPQIKIGTEMLNLIEGTQPCDSVMCTASPVSILGAQAGWHDTVKVNVPIDFEQFIE
jgi:hypothetical protein